MCEASELDYKGHCMGEDTKGWQSPTRSFSRSISDSAGRSARNVLQKFLNFTSVDDSLHDHYSTSPTAAYYLGYVFMVRHSVEHPATPRTSSCQLSDEYVSYFDRSVNIVKEM